MSDIDDMLAARAAQGSAPAAPVGDIDALLAARAAGQNVYTPPPAAPPPPAPSALQRFGQGLSDLPTGLGQLTEHVSETPLNAIRTAIRGGLNAAAASPTAEAIVNSVLKIAGVDPATVGAKDAASLFAPVSAGDFDDIVQGREKDYQAARTAAQQTGIDWWRLGGQASNPLNYLGPGGAAATVGGRIAAGAAQGAALSGAQPSTTPGSFWWDKAKDMAIGGATGGIVSAAVEGALPLIQAGVKAAKKSLGATAAASPTADAIVNSALKTAGVDPATMNLNVLGGLKQEAQAALSGGEKPSVPMVVLRAKAESLPYPVMLLKGQLLGNEPGGAMQFAKEQNLRGIEGVGEPLTNSLVNQNAAFINNLDALGAKNALDPVEFGQQLAPKVQGFWDQLQARKDSLYSAVRNSRGQPAQMDQFTAAQQIRDTLDTPEASHAFDLLPQNIKRTIDDLQDGKLPLTVAQMQSLDKMWGAAARGADGSTAYAINTARRILNDAPIADDVGNEARQAYQAARQAHAQQMSLVDPKLPNDMPNPNYQPLVDSIVYGGKAPETLFQTHFMGAAPSVAAKNLAFVQRLDPNFGPEAGNTLMGEIKRMALSGASDERGTVSNATLARFTQPVNAARMGALMAPSAVSTFRNLADVVEAAKRFPTASAVNTSNTGSAVVNAAASALKSHGLEKISGIVGKIPVVGPILNAKDIAKGLEQSRLQTEVQSAVNPGVTLRSLLTATPRQAARRALLTRAAVPAALGATESNDSQ